MDFVSAMVTVIVALRNEKGSYNATAPIRMNKAIVALRNEKGSYNTNIF